MLNFYRSTGFRIDPLKARSELVKKHFLYANFMQIKKRVTKLIVTH